MMQLAANPGGQPVMQLALLRIAGLPFDAFHFQAPESASVLERLLDHECELGQGSLALEQALFAAAGESRGRDAVEQSPADRATRYAILRLRRDLHNGRRPAAQDLDAVRTVLGQEVLGPLERHIADLDLRTELLNAYHVTFRSERSRSWMALVASSAHPLVEEGLYLASPRILPIVVRLRTKDPRAPWSHEERHAASKLAAYLARFCTKTSPNGIFCSVTLADIGGSDVEIRGDPGQVTIDVLLNIAEVRKVTAHLAVDPEVEAAIVPRPNPTLRRIEGGWSFWKSATPRASTDEEIFSKAKDHPVLDEFLTEAGRGAHDVRALLASVATRCGVDERELRSFYRALVDRGLLVGEIEIPYSESRPLRFLAAACRDAGCRPGWLDLAEEIEAQVDALPGLPRGERIASMDRIAAQFEGLGHTRPLIRDELFRVDSAASSSVRLPERILRDLRDPISSFALMLGAMYPEELTSQDLAARFLKEHPPDEDVPLLDLYRSFAGLPDSGRILEFPRSSEAPQEKESTDRLGPAARRRRARRTARRVGDWFRERARRAVSGEIVEVSGETIRELVGEAAEPRWSCGVLFQIAARSTSAVAEGDYLLVLSSLFNGTGLALARFARLLGERERDSSSGPGRKASTNWITMELRRGWSALERPGAILAELTYNHAVRTANAGLRPALFAHEIELPGDRSSRGAEALPLCDLVVRYDSTEKRLVIRSVSRRSEVIPILSSGVNPVGFVSDLVAIGRQGWQSMGYLPGFEADDIEHWPRFTCGRVVLFRERWVLRRESLPTLPPAKGRDRDAEWFLETARWRRRHRLPRRVFVHTRYDPKPFYVDLESPILADLLRRAVASLAGKDEPILFVTEMLPGPDELWLRDPSGSAYATELLVQLEGSSARAAFIDSARRDGSDT